MTRLPLVPWLWPLALPTLLPIVSALISLLRRWEAAFSWRLEALPGLLALWGLCLGLSLTWVLLLILPAGSQTLPNVVVWPPLLGYVAGRWAGVNRSSGKR
ncbi:hypothetical protein L1280_002021 [Deinococcus sp. HSC-46F16]|uniref:hypothetical protein n=1 Tax=Deinococcus sp. HSC-46F16 TaxID=2910968 RepID=UPI00209EBACB|nr:hypothetical protein [Deinococcus sp. HSC-46F16]MCP2014869.1 hypothetical protein [Deinococcus sp. HSC-46F16]